MKNYIYSTQDLLINIENTFNDFSKMYSLYKNNKYSTSNYYLWKNWKFKIIESNWNIDTQCSYNKYFHYFTFYNYLNSYRFSVTKIFKVLFNIELMDNLNELSKNKKKKINKLLYKIKLNCTPHKIAKLIQILCNGQNLKKYSFEVYHAYSKKLNLQRKLKELNKIKCSGIDLEIQNMQIMLNECQKNYTFNTF